MTEAWPFPALDSSMSTMNLDTKSSLSCGDDTFVLNGAWPGMGTRPTPLTPQEYRPMQYDESPQTPSLSSDSGRSSPGSSPWTSGPATPLSQVPGPMSMTTEILKPSTSAYRLFHRKLRVYPSLSELDEAALDSSTSQFEQATMHHPVPVLCRPPIPTRSPKRNSVSSWTTSSSNALPLHSPSLSLTSSRSSVGPATPTSPSSFHFSAEETPASSLPSVFSPSDRTSIFFEQPLQLVAAKYTFAVEQTQPTTSSGSWFRRKLASPSVPRTPRDIQSSVEETSFIHWLNPSQASTFSSPTTARSGPVHPALTKTSLTIPLIGDATVATRIPLKRWISTKPKSAWKASTADNMSIGGIVSDGLSTRVIESGLCCFADERTVMASCRSQDANMPVAVLCFKINDMTTLDSVKNKWSPLLSHISPRTPLILLGLSQSPSIRPKPAPQTNYHRDQDVLLTRIVPTRVGVSRKSGIAAAEACGAVAYLEVAEESLQGLEEVMGCLLGYGTSRKLAVEEERRIGMGVKNEVLEEEGDGVVKILHAFSDESRMF